MIGGSEKGLAELCLVVQERIGLLITAPERSDNRMRLERARDEAGCPDWTSFAARLRDEPLTGRAWAAAIQSLTIGETYFFRHKPHFDLLRQEILPALIAPRRLQPRPWLRLWSAGCASGEEAYSLAILVRELIPDLADWSVVILGTDLNAEALALARRGSYPLWSFRDTDPAVIGAYCEAKGNRFVVREDLRRAVTFAPLNLVDPGFAAATAGGMDVIMCRNVTMYFSRDAARRVARHLTDCLNPGGWLFVGPSEPDATVFAGLEGLSRPGTTVYRRPPREEPRLLPAMVAGDADGATHRTDRAPAAPVVPSPSQGARAETVEECLRAAQSAADLGRHRDARDWCCRALDLEPTNPDAYFLLGSTHVEERQGQLAVEALRKAIYLDPDFALAHYALGHALRLAGDLTGADRAVHAAKRLLDGLPDDAVLRGGHGLRPSELRHVMHREMGRLVA